jgi:hypothetical protein
VAKFPWPPEPEDLRAVRRKDDVVAVAPMTALVRMHRSAGDHPAHWRDFRTVGPVATARFDPHPVTGDGVAREASGYGVQYAGLSLRTCVAEIFQGARVVDRRTARPWLVVFKPTRPLHLLDLAGTWPTRAGASQALSTGPRDRARAWARAMFAAYDDIDGLWYRSSMDGGKPAVCLWERARDALPADPWAHVPLDAPSLLLPLTRAARKLGYRVL